MFFKHMYSNQPEDFLFREDVNSRASVIYIILKKTFEFSECLPSFFTHILKMFPTYLKMLLLCDTFSRRLNFTDFGLIREIKYPRKSNKLSSAKVCPVKFLSREMFKFHRWAQRGNLIPAKLDVLQRFLVLEFQLALIGTLTNTVHVRCCFDYSGSLISSCVPFL